MMPCQHRPRRPLVAAATSLSALVIAGAIVMIALGYIRDPATQSSSSSIAPTLRSNDAHHRSLLNLPQLVDPQSTEPRAIHIPPNNADVSSTSTSSMTCAPQAFGALTAALHADLRQSLQPLHVATPPDGKTIHHDGLAPDSIKRAFVNNRIAMMGDSTVAMLGMRLAAIIKLTMNDNPFISTLASATNIVQAERELIQQANQNLKEEDLKALGASSLLNEGETAAMKVRIHWGLDQLTPEDVQSILDFKPKVILSNVGLHTLHKGFGKVEEWNLCEEDIARMRSWVEYERYLDEMIRLAEDSGAELLLLKTTNLVCDQMYQGDWETGVALYNKFDESRLKQCFERIKESLVEFQQAVDVAFSDEDVQNYCKHGVLNGHGSDELNRRLFAFMDNYHLEQQHRPRTPLKVVVYNDRDLQDCEFTRPGDGRHFHALNLARIRLLGHYIEGCQ